jgi:hypothetical protein
MGKRDAVAGGLISWVEVQNHGLAQERAVLDPDGRPVRAVVLIGSARKPLPNLVWSEHGMGASQPSTLRVLQHRPDVLEDRLAQWFKPDPLSNQGRLVTEHISGNHKTQSTTTYAQPEWTTQRARFARDGPWTRMTVMDQHQASPVMQIAGVTIDCGDPAAMASFYAQALIGDISHEDETGAQVRLADGQLLLFRHVVDYRPPTWPSQELPIQLHFEYYVDDVTIAEARLHLLGATTAESQDNDDADLIVMLDPAGHPFCIIKRP